MVLGKLNVWNGLQYYSNGRNQTLRLATARSMTPKDDMNSFQVNDSVFNVLVRVLRLINRRIRGRMEIGSALD